MTENQEQKLNDVHDAILRMEGRFNVMDERIKTNREFLLEHEQLHLKSQKEIDTLKADKNKVVGALWLMGTGFLAMVGAFIISLFKH